ncbi:MAG: SpoIIE family protein phosphatase [Candidatus Acidiferrum sp.]
MGRPQSLPVDVGVLSVPIKGEEVCGDGWKVRKAGQSVLLMVVDGLGHGVLAAEAAREAERIVGESEHGGLTEILQDCHDGLKKTRGAAMAMVSLQPEKELLRFAGVGNIGSQVLTPGGSRGMASHAGTLGHHLSTIQEFTFPWSAESMLVMHSDGLKSNWNLDGYPGIRNKHPALIAGILYRDFTRDRDDVTVLVAKNHGETSGS